MHDLTPTAVKVLALSALIEAAKDESVPDAIMYHCFDIGTLCFICLPDGNRIRVDLVEEWDDDLPLPAMQDEFDVVDEDEIVEDA